ncbi:MAG: AraC family transcriptional regulator [Oscillospiraceae bacterium]|nr:AraC family transcriptional regulator [Oscillospiraceae bacterium]
MYSLIKKYHPITASPFQNDASYREISPCDALKPYIRCFWGTDMPVSPSCKEETHGIVIPDTCMDIIFSTNYTRNEQSGFFCTLDEHSYPTSGSVSSDMTATFAVRFYAWTAILFSDSDFTGRKNSYFTAEEFFSELKQELEPMLFDLPSLNEKIILTEKILMKMLCTSRINNDLMNAVDLMLKTDGRAKISDISLYTACSQRQLERIFNFNMGLSPKSFSSLLRYQLLWQEMVCSPDFQLLDAVEKYGYTDQAHLLNDFRKRHLMTPKEAVSYALKNV